MDKNTLIAVALSVVVITGGFMIQSKFFPPEEPIPTVQETVEPAPAADAAPAAAPAPSASKPEAAELATLEQNIPLSDHRS